MPVAGYCVILIMSCVLQVGSLVLLPKKAAESCFACKLYGDVDEKSCEASP